MYFASSNRFQRTVNATQNFFFVGSHICRQPPVAVFMIATEPSTPDCLIPSVMSESLRGFVTERLAVAAQEILGLVEKTIADYREEVFRSKREILQLRRELDERRSESIAAADGPEVSEEMFPPQQEWNPNMEPQQSQDLFFQQIKEEKMELTATLEAAPSHCSTSAHRKCPVIVSATSVETYLRPKKVYQITYNRTLKSSSVTFAVLAF
ncbi:hypothetical protein EPR50_G00181250 [Perca flavescens]|uniref:Uncharacterized protein n=1 Tax=Perca flavescens TaxID=8167 RepID=A0A484CI43_PERFV|nr:hypothetical protein EPR50_G00181250 [Perca flavescens]